MNRNMSVASTYDQEDPPPFTYHVREYFDGLRTEDSRIKRHMVIAIIMCVALFAFEIFNFDTTRFALNDLIGGKSFVGIGWATILAIAFCAIDFAGLIRLFTPETEDGEEPREVWYLMGAWLLGATMNAIMTWWAVSVTLLNHDLGNEVLDRAVLLKAVPIFVAVLVWLTRILFIGALTVTGEQLMERRRALREPGRKVRRPMAQANRPVMRTEHVPVRIVERGPNDPPSHRPRHQRVAQAQPVAYYEADDVLEYVETEIEPEEIVRPVRKTQTQVKKRQTGGIKRPMPNKAAGRNRPKPPPVKSNGGGLRSRPNVGIQARAKS